MKEETIQIKAGAVIWATGWQPYDAAKIQPYGYDRFANVITSVEFERLADPHGPTGGKILRPSDGKEAKNVAFIQCAGSRDENHLRHCSRICCMASLKQTSYVRESFGAEGKSTIYYIDIRAIDRFEDFYAKVQADPGVKFVKSKVAKIEEDQKTGDVILHGVDTEGYHRYANTHDLAVLAIGMEPAVNAADIPAGDHRRFERLHRSLRRKAAGCSAPAAPPMRSTSTARCKARPPRRCARSRWSTRRRERRHKWPT